MSDRNSVSPVGSGVAQPAVLLNGATPNATTSARSGTNSNAEPQSTNPSLSYISRSLLAGGLAGCVAKTAVAPLDRVKILFQGSNSSVSQFSGSLLGPFRALRWIGQQQGIRGVYKGHQATLLRIFPYAALNYMCYEQYKRVRKKHEGASSNKRHVRSRDHISANLSSPVVCLVPPQATSVSYSFLFSHRSSSTGSTNGW